MVWLLLFGGASVVSLAVDSIAVPVVLAWLGGIILSYVLIPFLWIGGKLHVNVFIVNGWIWLSGGNLQDGYIPSCGSTSDNNNLLGALVLSFLALIVIFVVSIAGLVAIVTTFCAFFVPLVGAVASVVAVFMTRANEGVMNRTAALVGGGTLAATLGITALLLVPLLATGLLMRLARELTLASC